jgi:Bax protein
MVIKGRPLRDTLFIATVVAASVVGGCLVRQAKNENARPESSVVANQGVAKSISVDPSSAYRADIVPQAMTIQEKKARFKALIVPVVNQVYTDLDSQYHEISQALLNGEQSSRIVELKNIYNVTTDQELLMALKPHPRSIVLAQAAIESAWGTSRFFTQANNVFGVWSFDETEPRIAARQLRGDKTIWLRKYGSIVDSVKDNYQILAKGDAFKAFRAMRLKTDDPYELVKMLDRYSEKGHAYGESLASMISYNQFSEYDGQYFDRQ